LVRTGENHFPERLLRFRPPECRLGGCGSRRILNIADDADHGDQRSAEKAEALADRAFVGPITAFKRAVDDRDVRRIGVVRSSEKSAREQGNPETPKIVGRSRAVASMVTVILLFAASLDIEAAILVVAGPGNVRSRARKCDAGDGLNYRNQAVREVGDAFAIF
jgi:hypothetical protein